MFFTGGNPLTKLAQNCNKLAQRLQRERSYKVTLNDQQNILQPFAQIWQEQSSTTVDDLLDAGLDYDSAAFLVGWLEIRQP